MKPIFEEENFLDPYTCKKLTEYQENNSPNDMSKGFWQSRIVTQYDYDIKKITDIIHARIAISMMNFYNHKVYLEFTNLVYWGEGMELELHADNFWIDNPNKEHYTPHRDYSSVLYK